MRLYKGYFIGILSLLPALSFCNNYGLLEKLESSGASAKNISYTQNNYIFVSSWLVDGTINPSPYVECAGQTGIARADCACTKTAEFNGKLRYPGHKYYAWLSMSGSDAICRMQGLANGCNTSGAGTAAPWFNTMGNTVVNNLSVFTTGALSNPVLFDETGGTPGTQFVWTGTSTTGISGGTDCGTWLSTGSTGSIGDRTSSGTLWTQASPSPNAHPTCNTTQRIYCIAAPN